MDRVGGVLSIAFGLVLVSATDWFIERTHRSSPLHGRLPWSAAWERVEKPFVIVLGLTMIVIGALSVAGIFA